MDIDNLNRTFSQYPITIFDKGWIYGVWYLGTAWKRAALYGQYPPHFLDRALALFPDSKPILHCPSGTVKGPGITVDIKNNNIVRPMVVADSSALPFKDKSFDLILSDPPYSQEDCKKYGVAKFSLPKTMKEFYRVLKHGGHLGMLHVYYPAYSGKQWALRGLICVVTGFLRRARLFSILEKLPKEAKGVEVEEK